jgi:hypothetical protein
MSWARNWVVIGGASLCELPFNEQGILLSIAVWNELGM